MRLRLVGWRVLLASLASIAATTFLCYRLIHSSATTAALLLLLIVLLTAVQTRLMFAVFAALVATACLDVFFFPPIGSIAIAEPQNWVALTVFSSISVIAAKMSSQLRTQRDRLVEQQRESERLNALIRSLLLSGSGEDRRRLMVNESSRLFELEAFVLFESLDGSFSRSSGDDATAPGSTIPEAEMRNAKARTVVEAGGRSWVIVPVRLGNLFLGTMAYVRSSALPTTTIDAWGSTVALGLAQTQAQEAASRAIAVRRSEELKSVMIDALAHDLKTPLTAIEAAASMLGKAEPLSLDQSIDMVAVIQEESRGLRKLVDEAIHLARIDAKKLKLDLTSEPVLPLLQAAVTALGDRGGTDRIYLNVSHELPAVLVDAELIIQAMKQLLDNALKYSPPRSPILVSAQTESESAVNIGIRDSGPGLTELEQSKVFDKFYRGRYDRSAIQGTGMGLAIAREIAEAHGGSVGVRSYIGQGTEFFIVLKVAVEASGK